MVLEKLIYIDINILKYINCQSLCQLGFFLAAIETTIQNKVKRRE